MSRIKPYRETICLDCIDIGDNEIKPTIARRCFGAPHFHYQKHQQETYKAKKSAKPKRQAKIKPLSDKRAKRNREYLKLRKSFLETFPECQAKLSGCTHEATQVHHKCGRIESLLNDTTYWLAVCHSCHTWIELNPVKAKELGLSLSRLSKAS